MFFVLFTVSKDAYYETLDKDAVGWRIHTLDNLDHNRYGRFSSKG